VAVEVVKLITMTEQLELVVLVEEVLVKTQVQVAQVQQTQVEEVEV
tara:strand:- start:156 stop:293 length:138 start_codon:yes stop_codon:yes gene_type:complete